MSSDVQRRSWARIAVAAGLAVVLVAAGRAADPRFYPDDPVWHDDDRAMDAAGAKEIEASDYYDFVENSFFSRGDKRPLKAVNINTLDEVPDSSWFENRIGRRAMSIAELVRGPDRVETLSIEGWPIVQGKNEGLQPGWRVADPTGHLYQIEFDPPGMPGLATGAELIGTAFYYAFGYHVVDVYLVEVNRETLTISPKATIRDLNGKRRPMTMADVDWVLDRAARLPNGRYRALASRFADGAPLGSFRYYGTRPDDPNDIFPHEHRRELRGNRVFSAWLNHDDSRGINSLDMLETGADGRRFVRHYMFDFGSIMGSGTNRPQTPRAGNEYIVDWTAGFKTLASFGLWIRPWLTVSYPDVARAVGNFEADRFEPLEWKPEYPNVAFDNMRPDDAFWAARIVAKFSDEIIRAIAGRAKFVEAAADDYLVTTLIRRRDKVLRTWLTGINPIVEPALSEGGLLTFRNAAVDANVATAPERYRVTWSRFDNQADVHEPIGDETNAAEPRVEAPRSVLTGSTYVAATVRTFHREHPAWLQPVRLYFRREPGGWTAIGIDRDVLPSDREPRVDRVVVR